MEVIKKSGLRQPYEINKVKIALQKTAKSINESFTEADWKELKPRILARLESVMEGREEIFFWEIDDAVIDSLLRSRFKEIAKEYITSRSRVRQDKLNDIGINPVAFSVVKERYLRKDAEGNPIETIGEMFCRVATEIARVEKVKKLKEDYTDKFKNMLCKLDFLPNSPALVSAGAKHKGTYLACYAYGIEDSLEDIMAVVYKTAKTFQLGGGVGVSIAKLREQGAKIDTTNGHSSGSVEFLKLFDTMCTVIKTGGFRRGALMCLTEYDHPDIEWFIRCKKDTKVLNNMNISVLVNDDFFTLIKDNKDIGLVSPKTKTVVKKVNANLLLEMMALNMWESGEPGILFYNRMNKDNPTPHLGDIRLTNPCSESNLRNNEACCLGSINLVNHLTEDKSDIDWDKLAATTKLAVRFLDNMLDATPYPGIEVAEETLRTRKIGLGVMGFADALIYLKVKYSSPNAIVWAGKIMSFINDVASQESIDLGKEKGVYPACLPKYLQRRNAIVTVQAPTGTLSMISGISPGIEPNFYKSYNRNIVGIGEVTITHPLRDNEFFEIATQIPVEQHLAILAEFQKYVENSVSKTLNVPETTTVQEIKELIIKAHDANVKGITILRERSNRESLIKVNCEECRI
jgi:ribonucleoside-diphosphate reductase alpha chain